MGVAGSILDDEKSPTPSPSKSPAKPKTGEAAPEFQVSLSNWANKEVELPATFLLRLSEESLDFVNMETKSPIIQFPYQNIICWGQSSRSFQFKIFDLTKAEPARRDSGALIELKTLQGEKIAEATMATVRKLMAFMQSTAISKEEFQLLLNSIFHENDELDENWLTVINQFTSGGRLLLAKQGMELLIRVGNRAPFEKFELACLIYDRMINKNSFQLLVNTFEDPQERDNLIHHLKQTAPKTTPNLVKDCIILPEKPVLNPAEEK